MKNKEKIIIELVLIFSGVLVFRSLWTMMDKVQLLNEIYAHVILLVIGITLSIFAVNKLIKTGK